MVETILVGSLRNISYRQTTKKAERPRNRKMKHSAKPA